MCGFLAIVGHDGSDKTRHEMLARVQRHRGPDGCGVYTSPRGRATLIHNRLSIIDLSSRGHQPMRSADGQLCLVFNGEIYNYKELRARLGDYPFQGSSDSEVLLAAYQQWGERALDELIGMFSFVIWDERTQSLFGARDRFGVKPFVYHLLPDGGLMVATEIKALQAAGAPAEPAAHVWATYLAHGLTDHSEDTFWEGIRSLPPGYRMRWRHGATEVSRWYDLADRVGADYDERGQDAVEEEYSALLKEAVRLRFRSDVPVGVSVSGGLDSSALLAVIQHNQEHRSHVKAFTFITGDARYDELPWVQQALAATDMSLVVCRLTPQAVPELALSVQEHEDEPYGGLPTLAYACLFERARAEGVIVLLDGQGMDEQWAGYDYYAAPSGDATMAQDQPTIQGTRDRPTRPECLTPEFAGLARRPDPPRVFPDPLRNLQYRDARFTKIPRALRFNDRVSMRSSTELREPFLDHRLFELALRQPPGRKIHQGVRKWTLRRIVRRLAPREIAEAPKRPLQTPQREWLRGPLRTWANDMVEVAVQRFGGSWLDADATRREWQAYCAGGSDNSFYVWQWITVGMCYEALFRSRAADATRR